MRLITLSLFAAAALFAADAPKPTPELERAQMQLQVAQARAAVARANYAEAEARITAAKADQARINAEWPAIDKAVREAAEAVQSLTNPQAEKAEEKGKK
jgi:multidrug resistance efflux pump